MLVIKINNCEIELLPEKAIHFRSDRTLLLADLHFGKLNHFRRSGIAMPPEASRKSSENIIDLLNKVEPERVIFLGDLFHSHYNQEWEEVGQILRHFSGCSFELVLGNHDIMSRIQYERYGIKLHEKSLIFREFILTHEPLPRQSAKHYNIYGHIHPGLKLSGKGRQSLTLPCFFFGKRAGILPAFGAFTGLARIFPEKGDQVFVVAENQVLSI